MKFVLICLFFVASLYADDIHRINSIVEDITKLRTSYEECQRELMTKESSEIKRYKKLLKTKDEKIKYLENKLKSKSKTQIKIKKVCENTNKFPKLSLKAKYIDKKTDEELPQKIPASTFRLKIKSGIYDDIGGKRVDVWDAETSFTSNMMSQNWVKITGYFVDRKWTKAKSGMWVKKAQVVKR